MRNVLFVKGQAAALDSAQAMISSLQGDVITVHFGSDVRHDVPDAWSGGG